MPRARTLVRHGLLTMCLGTGQPARMADDDCNDPSQRWQTREAVRQMAAQRGWDLQRIKIDDGCYEVRGQDASGRRFKAKIDPETLAVLKFKHRDGHRDQERRRTQEHGAPPAQGSTAPVFTRGGSPRGQID